jgi:Ca-activated chloride channel family protein
MFSCASTKKKIDHSVENEIYAVFEFLPPVMDEKERAPLELALVLDVSGSMAGSKIDYLRKSVSKLIELLDEKDRVSITLFDSSVEILSRPVNCSAVEKKRLLDMIRLINSGSSTNLSGGLFKGLEFLQDVDSKAVRKCLLFTDGQANVGVVVAEELTAHALELRKGAGISTFGYGFDYNSSLLTALAQGGSAHYIDSPDKIMTAFALELGELVSIFAQNVEVSFKAGEGVEIVEVLNNVTVEEKDGVVRVSCDDLIAEQPYRVVLRLKTDKRDHVFPRDTTLVTADAKFMNLKTNAMDALNTSLKVRFVDPAEADKTEDATVAAKVGLFIAAKIQTEAIHYAEAGNYTAAVRHVEQGRQNAYVTYSFDAGSLMNSCSARVASAASFVENQNVMRSTVQGLYRQSGAAGQSIGAAHTPSQQRMRRRFEGTASKNPAPVAPADPVVHVPPAPEPTPSEKKDHTLRLKVTKTRQKSSW